MHTSTTTEVIDAVRPHHHARKATVGDIIDGLGEGGPLVAAMVVAALIVSPLSGIPGFSSLAGICIFFFGVQIALGRETAYLPRWIMRLQVRASALERAAGFLERPASALDRNTKPRLALFVGPAARRVAGVLSAGLGAIMPLLELVPFSSSIAGAFIALLMAGLISRDGLIVATFGLILTLAASVLLRLAL